jgi:hypothetical protein
LCVRYREIVASFPRWLAFFPVVLLVPACSSSHAAGAPDAAPPLPPGVSAVTLSMESHVLPGTEAHTCEFIVTPTHADGFVVAASHVYTPGSHHMILFRTDLTAIPPGGDQPVDCYASAAGGPMSHVRGIIYGAQTPTGQMTYPTGVGLPLAAGEVVLMQTHYLNASSQPLDARADLTLDVSDGTGITTHAGVLFFYDPFIDVPPASTTARAQMRCAIPSDITLITAASHYHARGNDYAAYVDPPNAAVATTPFYTSKDWDHPTTLGSPLSIAAGSRVRFSCGYQNADPTKEYFQGQSAADDEMCTFFAIYYPEMGQDADFCMAPGAADMLGTGTQTCSQTLSCLQTCATNGAAPIALSPGHTDVDPCNQKCFVTSCGPAAAKLAALNACVQAMCAAPCGSGAGAPSSACQQCALSSCNDATNACLGDTCP